MAQFLTVLSILFILAVIKPIVCPASKMFGERRDRAPYIESSEHSPQYLSDANEGRSIKRSPPNKEQSIAQALNPAKMGDQETKDSVVDKNIRSVFHTNFGPGLHLFNETSPPTVIAAKPDDEKMHVNDCLEEDEIKNNKTYCSNLRKYPKKDHLEELIEKKFSNLEAFFGEDLIVPETIDHRMGNDPNEEFFCRSRQVVIYPQSGQNEDYEWFYIVNSDKFKQGIRIEECLDPYKPCGEHVGLTLPSNYETSCEQHYIYRTLVAYDDEKDALFKETFRLPACCKCVLRNKLKLV